jgi:hypothetical protein
LKDSEKEVLYALKEFGDNAAHNNIVPPSAIINLSIKIIENVLIKIYDIKEQKTIILNLRNSI